MENYLKKLIAEGENQKLDFKYCISDSRKIARTLTAFANSDGGRILIGVRDNGSIAGIKSDEEYYMVDTAALLFCRPAITFTVK
jgi:predicted HTH transcriptional regulator